MDRVKRAFRKLVRHRKASLKNIVSHFLGYCYRLLLYFGIIKPVNTMFQNNMDILLSGIPESNGSHYYQKSSINIGIITDEYMFNYYKDAVNLFYLPSDGYKDIIDNNRIDIVMFISCWKGMGSAGDWRGMEKRHKAIDVFMYAKEKNIKTVFQSIEDPSNYHVFVEIAKAADYIFTSCVETIGDYKKDTSNDNVFLLDFGVNPILHNPVGFLNKQNANNKLFDNKSVFFAGSWAPRYKERCADMSMIFDGVIKAGLNLIIADRNMYIKGYNFPYKYLKYIIPPIEHIKLQKVHKLFNWTININSIKNSQTMCAMRIYEVQALGGIMISNYALSVSNVFPNIFTVFDSDEVGRIINGYTPKQLVNMQISSIRSVMSAHTVFDRLNRMFEDIQYDYQFRSKKVLVLCKDKTETVLSSFNHQTYQEKDLFDYAEIGKISKNQYDYLIIFRDKTSYERYYLEDLINAFKYVDAEYTAYADGNQNILPYNYVENTNKYYDTMYDINRIDIGNIEKLPELALKGFAIQLPESHFSTQPVKRKLGVIIPVYNNGKYLKNRCIPSLARSSIFDNMHLYIIDDGSTDVETVIIIKELKQLYDNISTFFYNDGGSGSASRSRNKGIALCQEEYVTYLDPDNEAINDGYARLLEVLEQNNVDLAFGTILKVSDTVNRLCFMYQEGWISSPRHTLLTRKFKSQSIQACVIKKDLITSNGISNPVGAAGQDTLFFYELMLNAKRAYHMMLPIHIYYAQRNKSLINTINKSFFEKFLLLETYQIKILKKYGVFEEYVENKFEYFLKYWYLEKLKHVCREDYNIAVSIINKIVALYKG